MAQAVFGAVVAGVVQHLLGAPDGHGRFAGDFMGGLQGGGHGGFVRGQHLVDQAMGQGFVCRKTAARVGQLFAQRHGQQLGQALQGAHVGDHADVDFLDAEKRIG